jgi:hypothetical protein
VEFCPSWLRSSRECECPHNHSLNSRSRASFSIILFAHLFDIRCFVWDNYCSHRSQARWIKTSIFRIRMPCRTHIADLPTPNALFYLSDRSISIASIDAALAVGYPWVKGPARRSPPSPWRVQNKRTAGRHIGPPAVRPLCRMFGHPAAFLL